MKTIYISGIIGYDVTANDIREQINPSSKERLRVIINSAGGYVSEGFEIYNILKSYKGGIEIVIGVMAASIASYIAMAAGYDSRKAFKNSSFMVHESSSAIQGRARDLLTAYERVEGINNIMADAYAEGFGIKKEQARDMMREDKFFTGWEALVDSKIISEIIDLKDVEIPQKEEDEKGFLFFTALSAQLEKNQDISVFKQNMYAIEEKINSDIKKSQDDMLKAVAYLKPKTQTEIKADNQLDNNKTTGDVKMKLQELLKQNPEAQAELDTLLQAARDEGKKEVENAKAKLQEDRARLADILELEGVALSETATKALDSDMSASDYAMEKLKAEKNKRTETSQSTFGKLATKQTPDQQDTTTANEVAKKQKEEEEFNKKLEESMKNRKVI